MRLGVDIGGTNFVVGLVDDNFKLIDKVDCPANAQRPDTELVADIIMLCKKIMEKHNLTDKDVESIGIGVPGCHDPEKGVVLYCANINFKNTPVSDLIRKEIDVPVFLGNDADCAALGEAYAGATKGVDDSIMITIGTGIGGGIIINKKIYNGFNHIGGELGHIVIVADGEKCGCGRKGCWEAYSSATALIRMTKEKIAECESQGRYTVMSKAERISGRTACDAMRAGDEAAKEVYDKYVKYLAAGITNLVNIFQPEVISLGGGVSNEGQSLIDAISPIVHKEQYGSGFLQLVKLRIAELGNDAGMIGAAMM